MERERDEEILNFIKKKGKTCVREISDALNIPTTIVSIRLRSLNKWGNVGFETNPDPHKGDIMSRAYKWWYIKEVNK